MSAVTVERRSILHRRIRLFVAATITYNIVEAVVAVIAGTAASSVALIGFGLDSVVEVLSAAAVAWQFAGGDPERREQTALRTISFSFFALAAYLLITSGLKLSGVDEPAHSPVGMALTALSLLVMPLLSYGQRRTGRELGSRTAVADSKQTLLCTYLSGVVFLGLLVNTLWGWTWADPVAALVIAAVAVREGIEAARGETCACTVPHDANGEEASTRTPVNADQPPACCGSDGCDDRSKTFQIRRLNP
jgi:divalent metal cation (Fe/Co/Zn/Cd) transporter